jgi:hypothetical protein
LRDERSDGIETLDWIADQPWFDGRIGLWGGSYFGYTQWVLADQIDPGPSALFVQVCSTDWYRMLYPGGAFSLESALYWSVWIDWEYVEKPSPEFLDTGYVGFPLVESDDRTGQDIGFFNEMALHTDRDRFWMEIDGENRAESLVAPALLMAGWYDPFLPTMLDDYKRIRLGAEPHVAAATRLTIGPWAHARAVELPEGFLPRNYRIESLAPALPWYDLQFRAEAGQDDGALPVRIFVMGRNEWREEEAWPLARAIDTNYYLRSDGNANSASGDGALSLSPPGAEEPPDTYTYDPRKPVPTAGGAMFGSRAGAALQENVESRPDVLVYTTPPLQEDLEVTGPIKLILNVSTTALSTDFTGKLVDVYPDGSAYNISDGILRRDYDPRAEDSVDSRTEEIAIDLWPTSIVFFKGHRIRLQVSSSNYPRFDRNPNTRGNIPTETDPIVANQKVHHAPNTLSRLILPVIPR